MSWRDFWNGEHAIYVSERHKTLHYRRIALDIAARTLELHVDEAIIAARRALWKPVEKAFPRGFMDLYRDRASSAAEGAMLL